MTRDYSSFSAAVKSRFRPVASSLGYEQLSPTVYSKASGGWFETFNLQKSSGNDFFYFNYGITIPNLCPVGEDRSILVCGHLLGARLRDVDGTGGFSCETKNEIESSAERIIEQYKKVAIPWFEAIGSWDAIEAEYLRINPISEEQVGFHSSGFGEGHRSATYAYLLLKSGRTVDALRWLKEAERILSLPEYITKDGRLVHEKEKYARLQKPEEYEVKTLQNVRATIELHKGA